MTNWTKTEIEFLKSFQSPWAIQGFLDSLIYNDEECCCSPRKVLLRNKAHCAEGAYTAASILRFMGYSPRIVDLRAINDDDHLITVYQYGKEKKWGSLAKSNTTVLRSRDPVFKTLRELVMSYYQFYFNTNGEKSLISYSNPLLLTRFDSRAWEITEEDLDYIGQYIDKIFHHPILTADEKKIFPYASKDIVEACFMGAIENGLFRPE